MYRELETQREILRHTERNTVTEKNHRDARIKTEIQRHKKIETK